MRIHTSAYLAYNTCTCTCNMYYEIHIIYIYIYHDIYVYHIISYHTICYHVCEYIYIYIYNIYIYIGSIAYQATIGILDLFVFDLHSPFNLQLGAAAMFVLYLLLDFCIIALNITPTSSVHEGKMGRWLLLSGSTTL